jgi:hypothetical protein
MPLRPLLSHSAHARFWRMKHAGPETLDRIEPFLCELRKRTGLKEKSRGCFYRGTRGFLHFHEHGSELFADVRVREDFELLAATTAKDRAALLRKVDVALRHKRR